MLIVADANNGTDGVRLAWAQVSPRGLIAVIADDLTGASDAGVQFARRGLRSYVVFDLDSQRVADQAEVVAVDTDTRGLSADAAYARVRHVAEQLRRLEPALVYKKVDSTLRGNLAAEIDAVMDAFDFAVAVVAPAYPAQGRTTRGGIQYQRGVPVTNADLVRMLRAGSRRDAASLVVCDAETEADLRGIADSQSARGDVLWVGSAGLAEQLAESLGHHVYGPMGAWRAVDGPILVVAGTASEVTRRQVAALADRVYSYGADQPGEVRAALDAGRDAALVGWSEPLARLAAECVRSHGVGGLILTGGETARAVCRELDVAAVQLVDEVEPGVPLGLLRGGTPDNLPVVTKAGAFGSDNTLLHAFKNLRGGNNS